MYERLDLFQTANAMARHAGARTAVVATNLANADTPDYRARRIAPFDEVWRGEGGATAIRATRPGHITASVSAPQVAAARAAPDEASPNGNDVSVEEQMVLAVEAQREHSRALTIYRHALTVVRTSLGR